MSLRFPAPVSDPCGVSGGYLHKNAAGALGAPPAVGSQRGDRGSALPPVKGPKTVWFANGTEEVGFMLIDANANLSLTDKNGDTVLARLYPLLHNRS